MHITKPYWPLIVAAGLLLAIISVQLTLSFKKNEGHFVYALDDPYIHMAIARNFAGNGVWGVTRYEFSSSTSSLLWTFLLAAAYTFTGSAYVPLIGNVLSAFVLLAVAAYTLRHLASLAKLILLLALVLMLPLPPLVFSGMEHTAHIAVCIPLIYAAGLVISGTERCAKTQSLWMLLLLAALATALRYESLFIILPVALLLGVRRRFLPSLLVLTAALFPIVLYGLISWSHGSNFLPNPLLLKGSMPREGILPFLQQAASKLFAAPHLLLLWLTAIAFSMRKEKEFWDESRVMYLIFITATLMHVLFAGIGWFYRYEAYLVAVGILLVGQSLFQTLRGVEKAGTLRWQKLVSLSLLLSLFTFAVLASRAGRAIRETVPAMKNTYDQQYQMARFLQTYYSGASIAANDIGAINFLADIRCLDLRGLGSLEVARAKLAGKFNTQAIAELAAEHQVRVALLYSIWFEGSEAVPPDWIEVGQWTTRDCVVCGNPRVSFYAVNIDEANLLKQNLKNFASQLPADVIQSGPFNEAK